MSKADDNPGSPYDQGASPWGIPAPSTPPGQEGGHLPAFEPTVMLPPREARSEPAPPPVPQPQPFYLAPPPQGPVYSSWDASRIPGGPGGSGDPDGAKRRKTLLLSGVAAAAVLVIAAGAIALGVDWKPKDTSDALASQKSGSQVSVSPSDAPTRGALIKPDGGDLADDAPSSTAGAEAPSGSASDATSASTTSAPGAKSTTTAGAKPGGGATNSPAGGATSKPGAVPVTTAAPSTAPKATTPPATTTKAVPPVTTTKAVPPPSNDCTWLNQPPAQMPTIQHGSTNVAAVKQLQCLLKKSMLGIKPLVIDGQWGTDTQSAVTTFEGCSNAPTVKTPGGTPPYPKIATNGVVNAQVWADLYFWDNQFFNGTSYYCNGTRPY